MVEAPAKDASGWYRDNCGTLWHVVFNEKGDARCHSEDHYYTAAYAETFKSWGWKREPEAVEDKP